jgi:UTP--glucose-1-phosphate uridylyltransferase
VKVTDLVEKPNQKDAPSNYAVIGRYLFDPAVFGVLETTKPGKNGEIQLTDAMKTLAKDVKKESGGGLHAVIFKGRRYDTGDKLSYLQSVVQLASEREDLGPAFKKWLKTFVNTLGN